jgi:NADPH-dependent 2,4-dienoyl-CoA reductase/sulfur reductase-like enzyme
MSGNVVDVAIVGGGPAGLAAAIELKAQGVENVVVLEREESAGGIPRHCGHPPFGLREFGRVLTGPAYARRLAAAADGSGVSVRTRTEVVSIDPSRMPVRITCTTPDGVETIEARRLLIATGTRESPRSARLASGTRPLGIMNTGALQAYAYLEHLVPFRRPVIVGTELVALSAILTCRTLGAKPVAMIEEGRRPIAHGPLFLYPRLRGIPVLTSTKLVDIVGSPRVDHVVVEDEAGHRREIACDGVIFSGRFVGEAHLSRLAGLELDPGTGGPEIDQFGRTSQPAIFAAGNLLRPVETAGWCYREGRRIGGFIATDLNGKLPSPEKRQRLLVAGGLRYVVPQWLTEDAGPLPQLQIRVSRPVSGRLVARDEDGRQIHSQRLSALPERRVLVSPDFSHRARGPITLTIVE